MNIYEKIKHRRTPPPPEEEHKWVSFTYSDRETKVITSLFKQSNLQIAFRTNITLLSHLSNNTHHKDKFTRSGDYKLTCPDCGKANVGQTGRDFASTYGAHRRAFRHNYRTSKFAEHLNNHLHSFGPIHEIMHVLQYHNKGPHLNTIERFRIHKEAASHNHLNDEHTITPTEFSTPSSELYHPSLSSHPHTPGTPDISPHLTTPLKNPYRTHTPPPPHTLAPNSPPSPSHTSLP